MKESVVIVGGGLIGVSTLYELSRRGMDATLIEAQPDLAMGTSFANGGMLTPSMSDPWNGPGVARHLARSLFDPYAPMKLRPHAIPSLMSWGLQFLKYSSPERHAKTTRDSFVLAAHSTRLTKELTQSLGLRYDDNAGGSLKLFANESALAGPLAISNMLAPLGLKFQVLTTEQAIQVEPALSAARDTFTRALYYPEDASGDACKFTRLLALEAMGRGGRIVFGARSEKITVSNGRVTGVQTADAFFPASQVVVAGGCATPALVAPLGLRIPVRPAKGYSITVDAGGRGLLPHIPVVDDAMHAAVTPFGDRLRAVGTAEFTGNDLRLDRMRLDNLLRLLRRVYPEIASGIDSAKATSWAGLRPMSADGLPFVGSGGPAGLWVNAGHGHLGWTMAVGSADLLAAQMTGARALIDPEPYRVER